MEIEQQHKAGFVNIIGKPNVGKSTLMNSLIGESLSIITPKAQTTRHRILGILNDENYQIVFSDTPGIIIEPHYKLHESMMRFVKEAISDADVILYLVEINEKAVENNIIEILKKSELPLILVINKIDLSNDKILEERCAEWAIIFPDVPIIPISAIYEANIDVLTKKIIERLPENPAYYDKEQLTDKPEKFFVSEIIREKILLNYQQELPYSVEVLVDTFIDEENIVKIRAIIYVIRTSQRGIIIGHKGEAIKRIGIQARIDIEKFVGKKVFLELFVKVNKDWRDNDRELKKFGYNL
ncbi:MAG: GTPase Era [Bacteroidetes bacterium GWF2_29_10]|nr:MAG: GTPase Era [Bacteroidetes bacterium GWF2_29_10]